MAIKVEAKADDRKQGMTLAEVSAFVQECLRLDIDPQTRIRSATGFGQQLQELRLK